MRFRKFIKPLSCIVVALLICIGVSIPARADDYNKHVIYYRDSANLISGTDKNKIIEAMQPISLCGNVGFITTNTAAESGESYFNSEYYNQFGHESGVIFFIDMYDRNLCIWTNGEIGHTLTMSACTSITDNVYKYAVNGDYTQCSVTAFNQIYRKINNLSIPQPTKYICNALVAASLALLIVYLYIKSLNKHPLPSSSEWLNNIKYICNLDQVNATMTKREERMTGSGNSPGGGHYGGGGGHYGGGGGHFGGGGHGGGHFGGGGHGGSHHF